MPFPPDDLERLRAEQDEEERRHWDAVAEDDARVERERREGARRAAIEAMEEWFYKNFENPESDTPRDPDDGEFIYPWGGPFDATQMLGDRFNHEYEEAWIASAVEAIEREGTVEWAPTSYGDYYEHPDPEESEGSAALSSQILGRLDALEATLADLQTRPTNIGHNQPPEDIGLPPYDESDEQEIRSAIAETRSELATAAPDPQKLTTLSDRFHKVGKAIGTWLAGKADLAVDETIKRSVQGLCWVTTYKILANLGDDLMRLAEQLISKF